MPRSIPQELSASVTYAAGKLLNLADLLEGEGQSVAAAEAAATTVAAVAVLLPERLLLEAPGALLAPLLATWAEARTTCGIDSARRARKPRCYPLTHLLSLNCIMFVPIGSSVTILMRDGVTGFQVGM